MRLRRGSVTFIVLGVLIASLSACGGGDAARGETTTQRPASQATLGLQRSTIYFLTDAGSAALGVRRTLRVETDGREALPRAAAALSALLQGPTTAEARAGLTSALPAGARLIDVELAGDDSGEAIVNLGGVPSATMSSVDRARVITQVTRTLVGVSGIERVRIHVDGDPWGLWRQDGSVIDRAYDYHALLGFYGVCTAKPGTEATPGDCFTALP